MMFALLGTLFSMFLVVGGGLLGLNHVPGGLLFIALGSVGMGSLTAAAKLAGFSHFVPASGGGMILQDLLMFCRDDVTRVSHDLYVTVPGSVPYRATGMFACRYNGRDVVIVEAVSNSQEAA